MKLDLFLANFLQKSPHPKGSPDIICPGNANKLAFNSKSEISQKLLLTLEFLELIVFYINGCLYVNRILNASFRLNSLIFSNSNFDKLYDFAKANGAIGGKILGAGGGGYFLFYCSPYEKLNLVNALRERGNEVRNFRFDGNGLTTWSIREKSAI